MTICDNRNRQENMSNEHVGLHLYLIFFNFENLKNTVGSELNLDH